MIFKDITKYVPAYFAVSQHFIYLFSTLNSHYNNIFTKTKPLFNSLQALYLYCTLNYKLAINHNTEPIITH